MSFSIRLKSKFESYAQIFTNNCAYHIAKACNYNILEAHIPVWGMRWCSWLRHCATSRKVAGLIPDGVLEFLIDVILLAALWPWG
jgi:hypothetical protein